MKKFFKELKSIFIILAIVFIFRSSILNWYVIPSGSLLPTLKIGDHVVVNKLSYGLMLPLSENRLFSWHEPQRGDVVVFKGNEAVNNVTLIKRVIGLPGDTISFTNGVLTVNGILAKTELVDDKNLLENSGEKINSDEYNVFQESGFSRYPHYIMLKKWGSTTKGETQTWVVPAHKLLLIGDNRDNSKDGRFWGFMDESRIYGRAFRISYSTYSEDDSWLPKFRGQRWFKEITN